MNNLFRGKQKKRTLIIIALALIILFIMLFFFSSQKPLQQSQTQTDTVQTNVGISPKVTSSEFKPTSGPQSKTLPYTVSYPEGWKLTTVTFQGGYSVMMRPPALWAGDPIIVVETYESPTDPAPKEKLFANDGFAKSTIMLADGQATMYGGTWHTRSIDGVLQQVDNQERVVFIAQTNALYVIKMYYNQSEANPVYESMFNEILSSFKIKK